MDIFFRIAKIQLEMTEKVDKFQQNLAILSIYETSFNEISVYAKTPFPFVFECQQPLLRGALSYSVFLVLEVAYSRGKNGKYS